MMGSASVSAAMRNSFCISNTLLVKFQRLLRQAEADTNITDVVQGRGDVAVVIVFRRRGAQRFNCAHPRANIRPRPTAFWRRSGFRRASSGLGPISELLYLTKAYNKPGRDPEIAAGIVAARGAVAEFRQHVIGLDQPERELAAESLQVNSAADREREARVCDVTEHVVIQPEVLKPEQSVSERLNLPARSQRELRAE